MGDVKVPERFAERYSNILFDAADNGGEYTSGEDEEVANLILDLGRAEQQVAELQREVAALRALLDKKWMPFDTAPKDGTEIAVYREDAGVFTASWHNSYVESDAGEYRMEYNGDPCWFTPAGEDLSDDLPTLWQPLPESPLFCVTARASEQGEKENGNG